ncbi:MAG TPA: PKD domain-containing protein [Dinghuibacter sp.]|uniref:PKD domain-containing protein n=1 Tax=Dinghuibacter sp. TaxID=2024697 RepID=UPI002BA59C59|nr:PKD domain-containing protein [Dinghuibacter sp.]HTJ14326.1 PKD domain-containing protein [Dinghuibacter sp.]
MTSKRIGCSVLFWLLAVSVHAQLQPGFTLDKAAGCSPLTVTFTNTTTGAGAQAVYTWNFGNGNVLRTTDAAAPAAAIYYTPQTYTVTLTVRDRGRTVTVTHKVTVYKNPNVAFTLAPAGGCAPVYATLTSTAPGATYFWDFGDGRTLQTTTDTAGELYTLAGVYSPSLTVTDAHGCSATGSLPNALTINAVPAVSFTAKDICAATDTAYFTNTSTGGTTYRWSYGDGTSGTDNKHRYANDGAYSIILTATNAAGCTTTATDTIHVGNAPITFTAGNACAGAPVTFTGSGTYNYGDGTTGTSRTHTYAQPGSYTVTLTGGAGGCTLTATQTLTVHPAPVLRGFQVTLPTQCQVPATVQFTDTSQGAVKWLWNFTGQPRDTSTQKNPSYTFTANTAYPTSLTVTDANGCTATATQPVYPSGQSAAIQIVQPDTVCGSVTIQPTLHTSDPVTQYQWAFGDGATATTAQPSHTYSTPGRYFLTVNYTTAHGCAGTAGPDTINVYPTPHAAFQTQDTTACGHNNLQQLINLSDSAASYTWIFGDGSSFTTPSAASFYHKYPSYGTDTVRLIASSPGCAPDTAVRVVTIRTVQLPYAGAFYSCNGNRDTVTFIDSVAGGSDYTWHWGDGSPDETDPVFVPQHQHVYPRSGSYKATITATFGACRNSGPGIPVEVLTRQHPLLTSPDTALCGSGNLSYQLTGLDSNYRDSTQVWSYPDGDTSTGRLLPGQDSLRLILVSKTFGCADTSNYIRLHISGPTAAFLISRRDSCNRSPVVFTDTSSGQIAHWVWNFGDSSTVSRTTGDTVMHLYTGKGHFTPTLTVTDVHGCSQTAGQSLLVESCIDSSGQVGNAGGVTAGFTDSTAYLSYDGCPPLVAWFRDSTQKAVRAHWDFGDGATAEDNPTPSHTYYNPGVYVVTLTAYGAGGDSVEARDTLRVNGPAAAPRSSLVKGCAPLSDTLRASGTGITTYTWDFGDGTVLVTRDSIVPHRYVAAGVYTPSLLVSDSGGCQAVFQLNAPILADTLSVAPLAPITRCDTGLLTFTPVITSLADSLGDSLQYKWNFGTGRAGDTAATQNASFDYQEGAYALMFSVTSPAGCTASARDSIRIAAPLSLQYPAHTDICIGDTAALIVTGRPDYTYQWTQQTVQPLQTTWYSDVVRGPFGCYTDTLRLIVTVHEKPTVTINEPGPITAGQSVTLQSNPSPDVTASYWSPADNLSCTECPAPVCTPLYTTTYTDSVVTQYGCSATDTVTISLACEGNTVRIPNAFTPNGDGINDYFMPVGRGVKVLLHMRIYNRWGNLVYSADNLPVAERVTNIGWNGADNPTGTYIYMLDFECAAGQVFSEKGTVTLIR